MHPYNWMQNKPSKKILWNMLSKNVMEYCILKDPNLGAGGNLFMQKTDYIYKRW